MKVTFGRERKSGRGTLKATFKRKRKQYYREKESIKATFAREKKESLKATFTRDRKKA